MDGNMSGTGGDAVRLNAFYTCPQGLEIALAVDALNDVPETIRQPERTLFSACWACESAVREAVVRESKIGEVGYCELRLGKITE
jgi:hypothetical protein